MLSPGACEGTLACSTCHLIFKPDDYKKIPDKPTDEELDMLDLAYGLTDTYVNHYTHTLTHFLKLQYRIIMRVFSVLSVKVRIWANVGVLTTAGDIIPGGDYMKNL